MIYGCASAGARGHRPGAAAGAGQLMEVQNQPQLKLFHRTPGVQTPNVRPPWRIEGYGWIHGPDSRSGFAAFFTLRRSSNKAARSGGFANCVPVQQYFCKTLRTDSALLGSHNANASALVHSEVMHPLVTTCCTASMASSSGPSSA